MNINVFGEVLVTNSNYDFNYISYLVRRPFLKPLFRICVLNPDETVDYVIPNSDIMEDGISFTEEYQNGQRKSMTLKLVNSHGKYTPSLTGIWLDTKFSFEIGLLVNKNEVLWFPKGVYVLGDISLSVSNSGNSVTFQLKDKYAIFEGNLGTLEVPYEIELGSTITEAIKGVLNFSKGNGYILDYKEPLFDPSFFGMKTQNTIRADEGDNLGTIIDALATQLSAEYYYNNLGNLCFYPINETLDDSFKPIIWTFENLNRELNNLDLNYKNEEVVNVVKVVGDNIDNAVCSAIATNENPASPICIQQIGKRMGEKYSNSNVWNDDLAEDLARYYLRKKSFVSVDFSSNVAFNPILTVNNICEVENQFLSLKRDKLLITSISFTSNQGVMSVKFCNTSDLPTFIK